MEGQLSDQWAGVRLLGSGYRSRHYHPWIPNRQARQHRIALGNARHRSGRKFQICLASTTVVIFLLRSGESSESMANHDSEVMVWLCSCRDDAGIAGVGIEGCERSDAAAVRAGANGGECRLVSGWVAQRGAA